MHPSSLIESRLGCQGIRDGTSGPFGLSNQVADWIVSLVSRLGYAGIALLTFLENAFPPIPSELIMPLAGLHTTRGQMTFLGAVLAGSVGSFLGTTAWYWLGRRVGEQQLCHWIERHGRWLTLEGRDLDRARDWFWRHGLWAVFLCRMVPGIRTWISLPAGFSRMPLLPFLAATFAGTLLWTAALTYAGVLLGENYEAVKDYVGIGSWIVIASVVVTYVWRQIQYGRKQRNRPTEQREETHARQRG